MIDRALRVGLIATPGDLSFVAGGVMLLVDLVRLLVLPQRGPRRAVAPAPAPA